ncbi:hypothetical protein ACJ72_00858 [Emergomyces africanus]|uniref:Uncharacterized protein n=1 Tax=Emergomyces africanus TaxID=1955775 RepID=A0A1B7P720_9EURO|nr:hypothetical protein ACJ72_00858 [Emergomyces africanus]
MPTQRGQGNERGGGWVDKNLQKLALQNMTQQIHEENMAIEQRKQEERKYAQRQRHTPNDCGARVRQSVSLSVGRQHNRCSG